MQAIGREMRVIDYLEARGRALVDVAKEVKARYLYQEHYLPHDVETREMTSALTRKESLEAVGLKPVRAGSKLPVADGINAVRNLLPRCVFDAKKCAKGLEALTQYRSEWDDKAKTPRKTPKHDWTSHGADAFRELAVQFYDVAEAEQHRYRPMSHMHYDPFRLHDPQYAREVARELQQEERAPRATESGMDWTPF